MKLCDAELYFSDKKYSAVLIEARKAFNANDYNNVERILGNLPSDEQLLESLVLKLNKHGKVVARTLREMNKDKPDKFKLAKGISSLLTHTIIEAETAPEYLKLLPKMIEQLNECIYVLRK
jgi:hypothetical protein